VDSKSGFVISSNTAQSTSRLVIKSTPNSDPALKLAELSGTMSLVNTQGSLAVTDDVGHLLTIRQGTGDTSLGGDLTVRGPGVREASVHSTNASAAVVVQTGNSSNSSSIVRAPAGAGAMLSLQELSGTNFSVLNDGETDRLQIQDDYTELLSMGSGSNVAFSVRGDLTVGGSRVGPQHAAVRASPASAWLPATRTTGNQVKTTTQMSATTVLKVCYATAESLGDEASDYVELQGTWMQAPVHWGPAPNPTRVARGSGPHYVSLRGLGPGNWVKLVKGVGCGDIATTASASSTVAVQVAQNQSMAVVPIKANLEAGSYRVCVAPSTGLGSFTPIHSLQFSVVEHPWYSPAGGSAQSATLITFQGASSGDIVVLQPTDCASTNTTKTTQISLGRAELDNSLSIRTHKNMTDAVLLRVCFATKESLGNSPLDFVQIGSGFKQTKFSFTI